MYIVINVSKLGKYTSMQISGSYEKVILKCQFLNGTESKLMLKHTT